MLSMISRTFTMVGLKVNDIIENGSKNSTALSGLEEQVDQLGGGSYNLLVKVGAYAVVLALMGGGLYLVFSNAGNRGDAKSKILWIVIGAVLIFGSVGLAVTLQSIGMGLFDLSGGAE